MKRFVILLVLGAAFVLFHGATHAQNLEPKTVDPKGKNSKSLAAVADFVLRQRSDSVPATIAKHFGMPTGANDLVMHFVNLPGEGRRTNAILVFRRPGGSIDIIFIIVTQDDGSYYYRGSIDGDPIKGFHVNKGNWVAESDEDTQIGFSQYRTFWQDWVRQQSASPGDSKPKDK